MSPTNPSSVGSEPLPSLPALDPIKPPLSLGTVDSDERRHDTTARHVDDLFKKWTRYISRKFKVNKSRRLMNQGEEEDGLPRLDLTRVVEIQHSAIAAKDDDVVQCIDKEERARDDGKGEEARQTTLDHGPPLTHEQFLELVAKARLAVSRGVLPRLNSKGSSGSYFVRDPSDSTTIGIFKPSDEDPYGAMNPKLVKWVHRSLHHLTPRLVPFGRSCLVPGQSYQSESAASVLDRHLESWIVPRTEVVGLTSQSFYYDWIDRERAKKEGGKLREKQGSFQVFLKGFTDASDFFAKHPYPSAVRSSSTSHPQKPSILTTCLPCCRSSAADDFSDDSPPLPASPSSQGLAPDFEWTRDMIESFQCELEKLVVLDYLIRNTDRGLDNFMIKPCHSRSPSPSSSTVDSSSLPSSSAIVPCYQDTSETNRPHLHLAAIDNSLAFPHTHPQGWRQYPFGWLYLPLPLLDNPWSESTRARYLAKLESPEWWSELHRDLRAEFMFAPSQENTKETVDVSEKEQLWQKQWSVVKGQGWNLVRSLREPREGPLELCRRKKVLVWDEHVLVGEKQEVKPSMGESKSGKSAVDPPPPTVSTSSNTISVTYSRPPAQVPSPLPPSISTSKPPPLSHRRTLSDYTSSRNSSTSSTSSTSRPSFALDRTASFLRKPLDHLARSNSKKQTRTFLLPKSRPRMSPSSSSSTSIPQSSHNQSDAVQEEEAGLDVQEEGDVQDDDDEEALETGFEFLEKLDQLEASELKRANQVEKEAKKLGLLESRRPPAPPVLQSRRKNEVRDGTGGKRKGFLRARSEEQGPGTVTERSRLLSSTENRENEDSEEEEDGRVEGQIGGDWGTSSEIILNGNGVSTRTDTGRLSMSWYGSLDENQATIGIDGVTGEDREDDGGARKRSKLKWVVHERLEYVQEPKRRFRIPW